jgi:hypothetical protein
MPSQIRVGCRVSAAVGPFLPIPAERANEGGRIRRHRSRYHGIVLRSFAEKQWTVYWEEVKKAADHFGNQLKLEKKETEKGLDGVDVEVILQNNYVKDQNGLDQALAMISGARQPRVSVPRRAPLGAAAMARATAAAALVSMAPGIPREGGAPSLE